MKSTKGALPAITGPRIGLKTSLLAAILLFSGCPAETPDSSGIGDPEAQTAEVIELENYETLIRFEDNLLGMPLMVRFDESSGHLFVFDLDHLAVLEFDTDMEIVNRYGGPGNGPGELQWLGNFFVTDQHLHIIDHRRFMVHRYDRNGEVLSSVEYGTPRQFSPDGRPLSPGAPFFYDLTGKPAVTTEGELILTGDRESGHLFTFEGRNGESSVGLGSWPKGSLSVMENDAYRAAAENRQVPALDVHRAIPVQDLSNPEEFFLVFGPLGKIEKHTRGGGKLWSRSIPDTEEVDTIVGDFFDMLLHDTTFGLPRHSGQRWPLRTYVSAVSGPDGGLFLPVFNNLFLAGTDPRDLWIHEFDPEGELTRRYRLASENTLVHFLDIDFTGRRIFALPFEEAELRAYPF